MLALSTTLHHLFSYLLDTLHLMRQVYRTTYRTQVADEWQKHVNELETKSLGSFKLDCTIAITGGRLSDFLEVMIMSDINESALYKLEDGTYSALRFLRRAAATSLGPCCERILMVLPVIQDESGSVQKARSLIKELLGASLRIEKEAELELLAAGEFFKWWKQGERHGKAELFVNHTDIWHRSTERDKHENPRRDDSHFHPIIHDTLTAVEYVQRGFVNPRLDFLLAGKDGELRMPLSKHSDPIPNRSAAKDKLQKVLADTRSRLQQSLQEVREPEKIPTALLPARGVITQESGAGRLFLGSVVCKECEHNSRFCGTLWDMAAVSLADVAEVMERTILDGIGPAKLEPLTELDSALPPVQSITPHRSIVAFAPKPGGANDPHQEGVVERFGSSRLIETEVREGHLTIFMTKSQSGLFDFRLVLVPMSPHADPKLASQNVAFDPSTLDAAPNSCNILDADFLVGLTESVASGQLVLLAQYTTRGTAPRRVDAIVSVSVPFESMDVVDMGTNTPRLQDIQVFSVPRELRPVVSMSLSSKRLTLGIIGGAANERRFATFEAESLFGQEEQSEGNENEQEEGDSEMQADESLVL